MKQVTAVYSVFIIAFSLLAVTSSVFGASISITKNLSIGTNDREVRLVKQVLAQEKLLDPSATSDYFGTQTAAAVKKFQEKYRSEVLTPAGLRFGTGIVGVRTRKKMNEILGKVASSPAAADVAPSGAEIAVTPFSITLKAGITHPDVKKLQRYLNNSGFPVALSGPGSFGNETTYYGPATAQAIVRFQKSKQSDILARGGESKPNGTFDQATARLVNDLIAASSQRGQTTAAPSQPSQVASNQGANRPPTVNAGIDQTVMLPGTLRLQVEATDDQKTSEQLSYLWTKVSGSGAVTFANDRARTTNVNFAVPGVYDLDIAVSDGTHTSHDLLRVTVLASSAGNQSSPSATPPNVQNIFRHRLTVRGAGAGGGMIHGSGISCGNVCTAVYDAGTIVTLTAVPIGNSVFSSWSGDCSGNSTCTLNMNRAYSVTANFSTGQTVAIGDTSVDTTLIVDDGFDGVSSVKGDGNNLTVPLQDKGAVSVAPPPTSPPASSPSPVLPPPPPPPANALAFLSTTNPAGVRLIILNLASSLVDPFSEINVPVTLSYTGTVPVTNISIAGMQAPFSFTGGTYPGTGGTCGTTITATCTIMINYKPGQETAPSVTLSNSVYKSHFNDLTLRYNLGSVVGMTDGPVRIVGRSQLFSDVNVRVGGENTGESGQHFGPIVVGRTGYRRLHIVNPSLSAGVSYATEARNVSVTFSSGPFSTRNATCGSVLISGFNNECTIDVLFSPQSQGSYSVTATINYDVGTNLHKTKIVQISGEGFAPDPARHLLVVYNSLSPESTEIKNYYLANRPGMAGANVLALSFDGMFNEQGCYNYGYVRDGVLGDWGQWYTQTPNCANISIEDFEASVKSPIVNWITSHPEKDIRHILMVYMPNMIFPSVGHGSMAYALNLAMRTTGIRPGGGNTFPSIIVEDGYPGNGYFTRQEYPGTLALVSDLWVGSVASTKAYIDKLKNMYNSMPVKSVVISAQGTGRGGTHYYFEDTNSLGPTNNPFTGELHRDAVRAVNPTASVTVTGRGQPYITNASNVSGYFSWGTNGGHSWHYANDGSVVFTGNSGWYPIMTYESYNGHWDSHQGDFTDWFSANAFGGTDYSNTPAAAVTHADEPTAGGVNGEQYFQCWEKGHLFIDCAYLSMRSAFMVPRGDPWITK